MPHEYGQAHVVPGYGRYEAPPTYIRTQPAEFSRVRVDDLSTFDMVPLRRGNRRNKQAEDFFLTYRQYHEHQQDGPGHLYKLPTGHIALAFADYGPGGERQRERYSVGRG